MITLNYDAIMEDISPNNEEWFCGLSTEEKAEVLNDLYWEFERKGKLIYDFEPTKELYIEWLKQPHTPKE